jgi:hypothetical protein
MRVTGHAFERHSSSLMLTHVLGLNVHDESSLDTPNKSECNLVLVIA